MKFADRIVHPTLRERGEIVIAFATAPMSRAEAVTMLAESRYIIQHMRGQHQRRQRSVRALRHRLIHAEAAFRIVIRRFDAQDRITGRCVDAPIPARP